MKRVKVEKNVFIQLDILINSRMLQNNLKLDDKP